MKLVKKSCKYIDVTDVKTILPYVEECLRRHKQRRSMRRMLKETFAYDEDVYQRILHSDDETIWAVAEDIAEYIAVTIKHRCIPYFTPVAGYRYDQTSGKTRLIGCETALQQFYDYVAVRSCQEIWDRRLVLQQCSSIKGRGQLYGVKLIKSYVDRDNQATTYAKKHRQRYSRKCKYFAKLDLKKCYPSIDKALFLRLFEHDCGNPNIMYLWREMLAAHGRINTSEPHTGLLIGALPSQWAAQFLISFAYRHAMDNPGVTHMVVFMDDMLLTGSNRRKLRRAIESLIVYMRDNLHMTVKPTWHIKRIRDEPIDMMGYVVHASGKLTMRARNFIHSRRLLLRAQRMERMPRRFASRLTSFKGFYIYSDCYNAARQLHAYQTFARAQKAVSREAKKNAGILRQQADKNPLREAARRHGKCLPEAEYQASGCAQSAHE